MAETIVSVCRETRMRACTTAGRVRRAGRGAIASARFAAVHFAPPLNAGRVETPSRHATLIAARLRIGRKALSQRHSVCVNARRARIGTTLAESADKHDAQTRRANAIGKRRRHKRSALARIRRQSP
ncbi:hypothetical protein PT2222_250037 [Paraburkholderia tropica]